MAEMKLLTPEEEQGIAWQIASSIWSNRVSIAQDSAVNTALYEGYAGIKSVAIYALNPMSKNEIIAASKLTSSAIKSIYAGKIPLDVAKNLKHVLQEIGFLETGNAVNAVQHLGKKLPIGALKSFGTNLGIAIGFEIAIGAINQVKERKSEERVEKFRKDNLEALKKYVIDEIKDEVGFNTLEEAFTQAYKDGTASQLSETLEKRVQERQLTLLLNQSIKDLIQEGKDYNIQITLAFLTLGLNIAMMSMGKWKYFIPSLQAFVRPDLNVANLCFGNTIDHVETPKHEGIVNYIGRFLPGIGDALAIRDTAELARAAMSQKHYDFGYTPCNVAKSEIEAIGKSDANVAAKNKLVHIFAGLGNDEYPFLSAPDADYTPSQIQNSIDAITQKQDKIIAVLATIDAKMTNKQQKDIAKRELAKQNRFFVDFEKDLLLSEKIKEKLRAIKTKEEALEKLEEEVESLKNKFWINRAIIPALDQAISIYDLTEIDKKELCAPKIDTLDIRAEDGADLKIVDHYERKSSAYELLLIGEYYTDPFGIVFHATTQFIKIKAYKEGRDILSKYPSKRKELATIQANVELLRKEMIDLYYEEIESRYETEQCETEQTSISKSSTLEIINDDILERNTHYAQAHAIYSARSIANTHQLLEALDELTRKNSLVTYLAPTFENITKTAKAIFEDLDTYFDAIDKAHPDGLSVEFQVLKAELLRTWLTKLITIQRVQQSKATADLKALDLYDVLSTSLKQHISKTDWINTHEAAVIDHIFNRTSILAGTTDQGKSNLLDILKVDAFTKSLIDAANTAVTKNDFKLSTDILDMINDPIFTNEKTKLKTDCQKFTDPKSASTKARYQYLMSIRSACIISKNWDKLAKLNALIRAIILVQQTPIFKNNASIYHADQHKKYPLATVHLFRALNIPVGRPIDGKASDEALAILLQHTTDDVNPEHIFKNSNETISAANLLQIANEVLSTNAEELAFIAQENIFIKEMLEKCSTGDLKALVDKNKQNNFGNKTIRKLLNQIFIQEKAKIEASNFISLFRSLKALSIDVQSNELDDIAKLRYYLYTLTLDDTADFKLSIPQILLPKPEDFVHKINKEHDFSTDEVVSLHEAVNPFFPSHEWLNHQKGTNILYPETVYTQLKSNPQNADLHIINHAPGKMVVIPLDILVTKSKNTLSFSSIRLDKVQSHFDLYRHNCDLVIVAPTDHEDHQSLFYKIQNFKDVLSICNGRGRFQIISSEGDHYFDFSDTNQFETLLLFDNYLKTNQHSIKDGVSLQETQKQETEAINQLFLDKKTDINDSGFLQNDQAVTLANNRVATTNNLAQKAILITLDEDLTRNPNQVMLPYKKHGFFPFRGHANGSSLFLMVKDNNSEHFVLFCIKEYKQLLTKWGKSEFYFSSSDRLGSLTISRESFDQLPYYSDYFYKTVTIAQKQPQEEQEILLSQAEKDRQFEFARHSDGFVVAEADIKKLVDLRKQCKTKKEYQKLAQINQLIRNLIAYQESTLLKKYAALDLERGEKKRSFNKTSSLLLAQLGLPIIKPITNMPSFDALDVVLSPEINMPITDAPDGLKTADGLIQIPLDTKTTYLLDSVSKHILSANANELAYADTVTDLVEKFSNSTDSSWFPVNQSFKEKVQKLKELIAPEGNIVDKNHILWIRKLIQKLIDKKDFKHIGLFLEVMGVHIRAHDKHLSEDPFSTSDFETIKYMLVFNGLLIEEEAIQLNTLLDAAALTRQKAIECKTNIETMVQAVNKITVSQFMQDSTLSSSTNETGTKTLYNLVLNHDTKATDPIWYGIKKEDQIKLIVPTNKLIDLKDEVDKQFQIIVTNYCSRYLPIISLSEILALKQALATYFDHQINELLTINSSITAKVVVDHWNDKIQTIKQKVCSIISNVQQLAGLGTKTTTQQTAFGTLKMLHTSVDILSIDVDEIQKDVYQKYLDSKQADAITLNLPVQIAVKLDDQKISALNILDILLTEVKQNTHLVDQLKLPTDYSDEVLIEKLFTYQEPVND